MYLKKNDNVKIIQGKDAGKKGKVIQVFREEEKVVVEGLNLRIKNVRAKKQGQKGERVQFAAPMDISNVMIVCPKCSKPVRVGYEIGPDKKIRICRKCRQQI